MEQKCGRQKPDQTRPLWSHVILIEISSFHLVNALLLINVTENKKTLLLKKRSFPNPLCVGARLHLHCHDDPISMLPFYPSQPKPQTSPEHVSHVVCPYQTPSPIKYPWKVPYSVSAVCRSGRSKSFIHLHTCIILYPIVSFDGPTPGNHVFDIVWP